MKVMFYTLVLLLTCPLFLSAQQNSYEQLYNSGQLPQDFTKSAREKYNEALANILIEEGTSKVDQENFFLESAYVIDQLLKSGYIIYNDPIGDYVNEVLDVIIDSNPELKKKSPRVYIFRSTEVNAFAVDQGIIFISIGLLSQLENEAQLALVLSHELVHLQEEHGLDGFLEATRIDRTVKNNRSRANTKQIDISALEKNSYSREQEIEADDKGLTYFLNTNYSFSSIKRVFDVLRYSYLPYDEIVFEPSVLEKLGVLIPKDYLLEELNAINPEEEDEEQSTHPALSTRSHLFDQRLDGMLASDEQVYIVSESRFNDVQMRSRIDLTRLFLKRQELAEAVYSGFLLEKIYGKSEFSKEVIGKALYGLTKFRNNKNSTSIASPPARKIEGESQQTFHILEEFSDEELNVVAIAYNYDRYIQESNNEIVRSLLVDLFSELYFNHEIKSLVDFYTINITEIDNSNIEEKNEEDLSKIDKIRGDRRNLDKGEDEWHKFAFSEVLSDTIFRNIAQEGFDAGQERKEKFDYYDRYTKAGRRNADRYSEEIEKNGYSLDINKVVIVNPLFIQLNGGRKNPQPAYLESESRQESLKEIIHLSADITNVDIQVLDVKTLNANDTEVFNDIVQINEWIGEQIDADGFVYQSYSHEQIQEFQEKYDTPYFMSIVVISAKQRTALRRLLNDITSSFVFFAVFDIRDGRRTFIKSDFSSFYMNDAFLKSELYDAFNQLSKISRK